MSCDVVVGLGVGFMSKENQICVSAAFGGFLVCFAPLVTELGPCNEANASNSPTLAACPSLQHAKICPR